MFLQGCGDDQESDLATTTSDAVTTVATTVAPFAPGGICDYEIAPTVRADCASLWARVESLQSEMAGPEQWCPEWTEFKRCCTAEQFDALENTHQFAELDLEFDAVCAMADSACAMGYYKMSDLDAEPTSPEAYEETAVVACADYAEFYGTGSECTAEDFDALGYTSCDCGEDLECFRQDREDDYCPPDKTEAITYAISKIKFGMVCTVCGRKYTEMFEAYGTDGFCAMHTEFKDNCEAEEFDALGLTKCECDDDAACEEQNEAGKCPEDNKTPETYASINEAIDLWMCNPCSQDFQAMGQAFETGAAEGCAKYTDFLAGECTAEGFDPLGFEDDDGLLTYAGVKETYDAFCVDFL
jgi:hypothetical protein